MTCELCVVCGVCVCVKFVHSKSSTILLESSAGCRRRPPHVVLRPWRWNCSDCIRPLRRISPVLMAMPVPVVNAGDVDDGVGDDADDDADVDDFIAAVVAACPPPNRCIGCRCTGCAAHPPPNCCVRRVESGVAAVDADKLEGRRENEGKCS